MGKRGWNREIKQLIVFVLVMILLEGAAILLWRWCNQQFMELMLGGGQAPGDPTVWKNQLRHWQIRAEAVVLKGYPLLFAVWILLGLFRKTGRWTPLLALPEGYAGAWLTAVLGRLLVEDPSIRVMENLTLARSAARSALVLAAGYLLLWLASQRRKGGPSSRKS